MRSSYRLATEDRGEKMTADAKTNNDSSENTELEKTEAKCKENEIENTGQTGEMLECSLCQVKEDAPKRLQLLHRPPYSSPRPLSSTSLSLYSAKSLIRQISRSSLVVISNTSHLSAAYCYITIIKDQGSHALRNPSSSSSLSLFLLLSSPRLPLR